MFEKRKEKKKNLYNIVLMPSMLVKWFIDLRSPRKIDVITCCKITDAISVHNAAHGPLSIVNNSARKHIFWAGF